MRDYAPRAGETFRASIHRVASGNGIIETEGGHINLGPVKIKAIGEEINALKLHSSFALCISDWAVPDDYLQQVDKQFELDLPLRQGREAVEDALGPGKPARKQEYRLQENHSGDSSDSDNSDNDDRVSYSGKYTVEINRISNSGNGVVCLGDREYSLEPMPEEAVGKEVEIEIIGGGTVHCLTNIYSDLDSYNVNTIHPTIERISTSKNGICQFNGKEYSLGTMPETAVGDEVELQVVRDDEGNVVVVRENFQKRFTTEIDRISNAGNGIVYLGEWEFNIGPIPEGAVGEEVEVEITGGDTAQCLTDLDEFIDEQEQSAEATTDTTTTDKEPVSKEPTENPDSQEQDIEDDAVTVSPSPDQELEELREQAKADAEEDITVTRTRTSTQEYSRSAKVRDYVKARASGACEGCGEPAPFTSATGNPYLHAHHVEELSDGGADTPDTVIALCPNCHYRVHHGEDGAEYNQELIEKLQGIES